MADIFGNGDPNAFLDLVHDAGGLSPGEQQSLLAQRQQDALDAAQQQQDLLRSQQAGAQRAQEIAARDSQYADQQQGQQQFMSWPDFIQYAQGPEGQQAGLGSPPEAYQQYVGTLSQQLQNAGWEPDQADQAVVGFMQQVPPPPGVDRGWLGNLWSSLTSGVQGANRAQEAAGAAAMGDQGGIAQRVREAQGDEQSVPMQRFGEAMKPGDDDSILGGVARVARAIFTEPQGAIDTLANGVASFYPALVGGAAGGAVGSALPVIGTTIGTAVGSAAGAGEVSFGDKLIRETAAQAQARGIDPTDVQGVTRMLSDPAIYSEILRKARNEGLAMAAGAGVGAGVGTGLANAGARSLAVSARAARMGLEPASQAAFTRAATQVGGGALADVTANTIGMQGGKVLNNEPVDPAEVIFGSLGMIAPAALHTGIGLRAGARARAGLRPAEHIDAGIGEDDLAANEHQPPEQLALPGPLGADRALPRPVYRAEDLRDNPEQKLADLGFSNLDEPTTARVLDAIDKGDDAGLTDILRNHEPVTDHVQGLLDANEKMWQERDAFAAQRGINMQRPAEQTVRINASNENEGAGSAAATRDDGEQATRAQFAAGAPRAEDVVRDNTVPANTGAKEQIEAATGVRSNAERKATIERWDDTHQFLQQHEPLFSYPDALLGAREDAMWEAARDQQRTQEQAPPNNELPAPINRNVRFDLDAAHANVSDAADRFFTKEGLDAAPGAARKKAQLVARATDLIERAANGASERTARGDDLGAATGGNGGGAVPGGGRASIRSSKESAINPRQHVALNEAGRKTRSTIGDAIARALGVAPEELVPRLARELTQRLFDEVRNGITTPKAAREILTRRKQPEAGQPIRFRRGLRPGERVRTQPQLGPSLRIEGVLDRASERIREQRESAGNGAGRAAPAAEPAGGVRAGGDQEVAAPRGTAGTGEHPAVDVARSGESAAQHGEGAAASGPVNPAGNSVNAGGGEVRGTGRLGSRYNALRINKKTGEDSEQHVVVSKQWDDAYRAAHPKPSRRNLKGGDPRLTQWKIDYNRARDVELQRLLKQDAEPTNLTGPEARDLPPSAAAVKLEEAQHNREIAARRAEQQGRATEADKKRQGSITEQFKAAMRDASHELGTNLKREAGERSVRKAVDEASDDVFHSFDEDGKPLDLNAKIINFGPKDGWTTDELQKVVDDLKRRVANGDEGARDTMRKMRWALEKARGAEFEQAGKERTNADAASKQQLKEKFTQIDTETRAAIAKINRAGFQLIRGDKPLNARIKSLDDVMQPYRDLWKDTEWARFAKDSMLDKQERAISDAWNQLHELYVDALYPSMKDKPFGDALHKMETNKRLMKGTMTPELRNDIQSRKAMQKSIADATDRLMQSLDAMRAAVEKVAPDAFSQNELKLFRTKAGRVLTPKQLEHLFNRAADGEHAGIILKRSGWRLTKVEQQELAARWERWDDRAEARGNARDTGFADGDAHGGEQEPDALRFENGDGMTESELQRVGRGVRNASDLIDRVASEVGGLSPHDMEGVRKWYANRVAGENLDRPSIKLENGVSLSEGNLRDYSEGVRDGQQMVDRIVGDGRLAGDAPLTKADVASIMRWYRDVLGGGEGEPNLNVKLTPADHYYMALASQQMREPLIDLIRKGSAHDVAEWLSQNAKNPLSRLIAKAIVGLNLKTRIGFDDLPTREGVFGQYRRDFGRSGDEIAMSPHAAEKYVLHELVHAATAQSIDMPTSDIQVKAIQRLQEIRASWMKAHPDHQIVKVLKGMDPQEALHEFVAHSLSDNEIQGHLEAMRMPGEGFVGRAWQALKTALMSLLARDDTQLADLMRAAPELFSSRKDALIKAMSNPLNATGPRISEVLGHYTRTPKTALLALKDGVRAMIAYHDPKTGKYHAYVANKDYPGGIRGQGPLARDLTREQVADLAQRRGLDLLPQAKKPEDAVTPKPPLSTAKRVAGYDTSGVNRLLAFKQANGEWKIYSTDSTLGVSADKKARVDTVADRAAVDRLMAKQGYRLNPPGRRAGEAVGPGAIGVEKPGSLRTQFLDRNAWIKNIGEAVAKANRNAPDWMRTDITDTLRNNEIAKRDRITRKQFVEPLVTKGTELIKRFRITKEGLEQLWHDYHTVERANNLLGRTSNTPAQHQADIRTAQAAAQRRIDALPSNLKTAFEREFAPLAKKLADSNVDKLEELGQYSAQTARNVKQAYQYYVPKQVGEQTTVGRAATGSNFEGDFPLQRMVTQAYTLSRRIEDNNIKNSVLDLADQQGLYNKDDATKTPLVELGPINRMTFDKDTHEVIEKYDSLFTDPNSVVAFRDGAIRRATINDETLLHTLKPFSGPDRKPALTMALSAMSKMNAFISIGKTSLSPAFTPFNFFRDALMASATMPKDLSRARFGMYLMMPRLWHDVFSSVLREVADKDAVGMYAEAQKAGALISQATWMGLDEFKKDVETTFAPTTGQKIRKGLSLNRDSTLFKSLTVLSNAIENATRVAVYHTARDAGKTEREAGMIGKNASINFENRGTVPVSPFFIFANAKLQGLNTVFKMAKDTPPKALMVATGYIAAGVAAGALGYKYSDKDKNGVSAYGKIPGYQRDAQLFIKEDTPGLPLPQELAMFYVLGNTIADGLFGKKSAGDMASRVITNLEQTLAPLSSPQEEITGAKARVLDFAMRMFLPSEVAPGYDLVTNHNTFGSEVVRQKDANTERGIPLHQQYAKSESALAINTSEALYAGSRGAIDAAPAQVSLLANAYLPTKAVTFWRDLLGGREPRYEGDEVNPLKRRFVGKATGFADDDAFEEALHSVREAHIKSQDPHLKDSLSDSDRQLAGMAQQFEGANKAITGVFHGWKKMSKEQEQVALQRKKALQQEIMHRYYATTGTGG